MTVTAPPPAAALRCLWCGRPLGGLVPATRDHVVPRVKGGPSWPENEAAACGRCNRARGHSSPADWLQEGRPRRGGAGGARRRGWEPDGAALLALLSSLERAIRERGGQRRARPYLDGQLRRLRRR